MTSIIYNILIYTLRFQGSFIWNFLWYKIVLRDRNKKIKIKIHNTTIQAKAGFPYPIITRRHPEFNNPLLQSAIMCYNAMNRPINIIDIGAGVGDTYFFLKSNMPKSSIKNFIAIEGDHFFYEMLEANCKNIKEVSLEHILLSDVAQQIPHLVHTHAGTASAIGKDVSAAYPLDSVILNKYSDQGIDFIKVDIDGYDGKAIKGAQQILRLHHPVVIFEWHPILTQKAKNDLYEAFNVLTETEYTDFVFFNKYGTFSHFISGVDDALRALAEVCLHNQHHDDWHYDVVAIPYGKIDKIALAECQYAKRKISMY